MDPILSRVLHMLWLVLVLGNFIIQIAYFIDDSKKSLYLGKKVTTPLMLGFALFIVVLGKNSFPVVPGLIFLAMGIGEMGIEGSYVVENRAGGDLQKSLKTTKLSQVIVTTAGVLFLLVNIGIGGYLLLQYQYIWHVIITCLVSSIAILIILFQALHQFKPDQATAKNMMLYGIGIIILFAGAMLNVWEEASLLGWAAALLTISDTLVLIRMGADYDKNTVSGFWTLLMYLIVILLVYYTFMGLLIHMIVPFSW